MVRLEVSNSYVWGLHILRLGASNYCDLGLVLYVWGLLILTFVGLISLRLRVSNFYVWGLVFLRLGVRYSYAWWLVILTFRG